MDLFNKKKVSALGLIIKNKENEIESLKSDVTTLERENYEMKLRLGEASKVSARVKSAESSFMAKAKIERESPSDKSVSTRPGNISSVNNNSDGSSGLLVGAVIGAAVVDTSHETPNSGSNSASNCD